MKGLKSQDYIVEQKFDLLGRFLLKMGVSKKSKTRAVIIEIAELYWKL